MADVLKLVLKEIPLRAIAKQKKLQVNQMHSSGANFKSSSVTLRLPAPPIGALRLKR